MAARGRASDSGLRADQFPPGAPSGTCARALSRDASGAGSPWDAGSVGRSAVLEAEAAARPRAIPEFLWQVLVVDDCRRGEQQGRLCGILRLAHRYVRSAAPDVGVKFPREQRSELPGLRTVRPGATRVSVAPGKAVDVQ